MKAVEPIDPGLCRTCRHAKVVRNDRGGSFWICLAHKFNPQLRKYPTLPVRACPEYRPADPSQGEGTA